MEEQATTQPIVSVAAPPSGGSGKATCSACGGSSPPPAIGRLEPGPRQATLVGTVTAAFPSLSVEKHFAQLLGQKDFKGFTDRQTLHAVLQKPENRHLARRMCFLHTPYGSGGSPAYILVPEEREDLTLLVDILNRPLNTSEFDVAYGRIVGMAPRAMCNAQELPILSFSQLYSFRLETFIKSIPRPEKIPAKDFEAACDELFHRAMRIASNATGSMLGLSYAVLSYAGLYKLVTEKYSENSSLAYIGVNQSRACAGCADIRLKFVKRDTGFAESFAFLVNVDGPFQFLEEPLQPSYDTSTP